MERNHDNICVRAAHQLYQAGFLPLHGASDDQLAMQREGVDASLAIQYEPAENLVRLSVLFFRDKPKRGLFRRGRGDLRIFVQPEALFGLICWITASQDQMLPDDADAWLAQIASLCPETYAVIASRNGHETLALVSSFDPVASVH